MLWSDADNVRGLNLTLLEETGPDRLFGQH